MSPETQPLWRSRYVHWAVMLLLVFTAGRLTLAMLIGHLRANEDFLQVLLWQVGWGLAWLVALIAVASVLSLSRSAPFVRKAMPFAALGLAWFVSGWMEQAYYHNLLRDYARRHAQQLAGTGPGAITYWEGVPDGGTAIVRSPGGDPMQLSQDVMIDLVGERLHGCEALGDDLWVCRFD